MISVSQLTKTYGRKVQALRGLDLEIGSGMFGLVGPNGAGKTTLMRILAGLLRPTSGKVVVLGHDVSTGRGKLAVKAQLGYLPQELGLYPDLSAFEFLEYVALLKGVQDQARLKEQVMETLELVGLTADARRRMRTFSGGMKRRIGIAQALLGEPHLLIVDEPTAGLDPEERVRLRNLLAEMASRCTVILSTHIVEDISQSCSQLAVIDQGKVVYTGSPRALIEAARGQVWNLNLNGGQLDPNLQVVSTMQVASGTQYRVIGSPPPGSSASPLEPTLEDGYLVLMNRNRSG